MTLELFSKVKIYISVKCFLQGHQPFYLNKPVIRHLNRTHIYQINIEIDIFQWITLNPFKILHEF